MTEPIRLWVLVLHGNKPVICLNRGKPMAFADQQSAADGAEELMPQVPMGVLLSTVELTEVRRCGTCRYHKYVGDLNDEDGSFIEKLHKCTHDETRWGFEDRIDDGTGFCHRHEEKTE